MKMASKNTTLIRVFKTDLEIAKRILPDDMGFSNAQRFKITLRNSAVNLEDMLRGRRKK